MSIHNHTAADGTLQPHAQRRPPGSPVRRYRYGGLPSSRRTACEVIPSLMATIDLNSTTFEPIGAWCATGPAASAAAGATATTATALRSIRARANMPGLYPYKERQKPRRRRRTRHRRAELDIRSCGRRRRCGRAPPDQRRPYRSSLSRQRRHSGVYHAGEWIRIEAVYAGWFHCSQNTAPLSPNWARVHRFSFSRPPMQTSSGESANLPGEVPGRFLRPGANRSDQAVALTGAVWARKASSSRLISLAWVTHMTWGPPSIST
jgi:hypothetical protein